MEQMTTMLCDDIIEMIGRELTWIHERPKWVKFWKEVVEGTIPCECDKCFNGRVVEVLWMAWKEVIWDKYREKEERWEYLTNI